MKNEKKSEKSKHICIQTKSVLSASGCDNIIKWLTVKDKGKTHYYNWKWIIAITCPIVGVVLTFEIIILALCYIIAYKSITFLWWTKD